MKKIKGKKMQMHNGLSFEDKDHNNRSEFRIKCWEDPSKMAYKSESIKPMETLPEHPIPEAKLKSLDFYRGDDKNVFFGHYWLEAEPALYKDNIYCLDYSLAKEGKLVAYRLNGESNLDSGNLVYV